MKALDSVLNSSHESYVIQLVYRLLWALLKFLAPDYLPYLRPNHTAICGVYLEEQSGWQRRKKSYPGRTVVVIRPKLLILGIPLGAIVEGAHVRNGKIVREFSSRQFEVLRGSPHIIKYTDLSVEGSNRFPCKGLIFFSSLVDGRYDGATGIIRLPCSLSLRGKRFRRVRCRWTRIHEDDLLNAVGRSKLRSAQDIREFIENSDMLGEV